jgi:hypothetical protein
VIRPPTRGDLLWRAEQDRVRHAQWLAAAARGGTCGLHRAVCQAFAADARIRLAATLRALRAIPPKTRRAA